MSLDLVSLLPAPWQAVLAPHLDVERTRKLGEFVAGEYEPKNNSVGNVTRVPEPTTTLIIPPRSRRPGSRAPRSRDHRS